jgi:hypothetical protein
MQQVNKRQAHHKPSRFEYRLLWVSSFMLVLPTITIKRLLPTQWRHWRRDKNIFTVVSEAREVAGTIAPMAFKAY